MTVVRSKSIPLPAAVLALSVAVCLGAASSASASHSQMNRAVQAEQRETIEHLIEAIQQAARKLTDRLAGQCAFVDRQSTRLAFELLDTPVARGDDASPTVAILREALLNLPPPTC